MCENPDSIDLWVARTGCTIDCNSVRIFWSNSNCNVYYYLVVHILQFMFVFSA